MHDENPSHLPAVHVDSKQISLSTVRQANTLYTVPEQWTYYQWLYGSAWNNLWCSWIASTSCNRGL